MAWKKERCKKEKEEKKERKTESLGARESETKENVKFYSCRI